MSVPCDASVYCYETLDPIPAPPRCEKVVQCMKMEHRIGERHVFVPHTAHEGGSNQVERESSLYRVAEAARLREEGEGTTYGLRAMRVWYDSRGNLLAVYDSGKVEFAAGRLQAVGSAAVVESEASPTGGSEAADSEEDTDDLRINSLRYQLRQANEFRDKAEARIKELEQGVSDRKEQYDLMMKRALERNAILDRQGEIIRGQIQEIDLLRKYVEDERRLHHPYLEGKEKQTPSPGTNTVAGSTAAAPES